MVDDIMLQDRDPALADAVAVAIAVLRPRLDLEKIEIVDIATRTTLRHVQAEQGNKNVRVSSLQADPLNRFLVLLTRTATKLVDRWEIGDAHAAAVRPRQQPDHAHDSVAARRGARERQPPVLARRQAPVLLRRRGDDPRDDEVHRGGDVALRAAIEAASAASLRPGARLLRLRRAPSPACSPCRTRCRSAASWASAGRPRHAQDRLPADRAGRAGVSFAHGAGPQARLRIKQRHRPLRDLDLRPRERRSWSAARSSRAGRAWCSRVSSNGKLIYVYQRRRDHRHLRRGHVQVSADDPDGRGSDDRALRRAPGRCRLQRALRLP